MVFHPMYYGLPAFSLVEKRINRIIVLSFKTSPIGKF